MGGKAGPLSEKPTALPARFDRLFPWVDLDRRCSLAREWSGDLVELWESLGGVDSLSTQRRWLIERIVVKRRQLLAFETALAQGSELPMTWGEYSNLDNVITGQLKTLGLDRSARAVGGSRSELMAKKVTP
jgi:hypothetical protein